MNYFKNNYYNKYKKIRRFTYDDLRDMEFIETQ